LRISGLDLPPELGLHLSISIWDAPTGEAGIADVAAPLGEVPIQLDQTGWVGVVDGRYRISVRDGARSAISSEHLGARGSQLYQLLALDTSGLPAEVEIHGETIDLPPIRAFLLENVRQIEPAEATAIDFETAVFRWAPVSGAHHYEVGILESTSPRVGERRTTTKLVVSASGPALRLADLAPKQAAVLQELQATSTWSWVVRAYSESGELLGKSFDEHTFRIHRQP
jgi:hypothetical protein